MGGKLETTAITERKIQPSSSSHKKETRKRAQVKCGTQGTEESPKTPSHKSSNQSHTDSGSNGPTKQCEREGKNPH